MIGRNPAVYAFPELNLFVADRVQTLMELDDTPDPRGALNYSSGLMRSVAELFFSGQTPEALASARSWLHSRRHWTTQAMMDALLTRVSPLVGVEKSIRTALSRVSLARALAWYPEARFLHLTRHPATAIESMHRCQAELSPQPNALLSDGGLREYCASLWLHAHQSLLRFTSALAPHSTLRLQAENILRNPDDSLSRIASWLDVPCGPADLQLMKHPEEWPFARPAEGLPNDCDSSFLSHPKLRTIPETPPVEAIRDWALHPALTADVERIAAHLGYT